MGVYPNNMVRIWLTIVKRRDPDSPRRATKHFATTTSPPTEPVDSAAGRTSRNMERPKNKPVINLEHEDIPTLLRIEQIGKHLPPVRSIRALPTAALAE